MFQISGDAAAVFRLLLFHYHLLCRAVLLLEVYKSTSTLTLFLQK